MSKQSILIILIGFFFGALITMTIAAHAVNTNNRGLMSAMGIRPKVEHTPTLLQQPEDSSHTEESEKETPTH